jgi:diguanylate cyclase (GGDEF)-like protein
LDIHTLHVEHAVFLASYTILTVANSWLYKGTKGVYAFSLYGFSVFLGASAIAMRGHVSDLISIVLGNFFVVIGYSFLLLSLIGFLGRKTSYFYPQILLLLVGLVTLLQYGWFHPDTGNRLIALSLVLGCQHGQIAFLLYRSRSPALRIPINSMMLIMIGLCISNIVRIVGVAIHGSPHNYLNAGSFLAWILIVNSCLQVGAMVSFVWMTAAMLRGKLEVQAVTDPLTGALNRRGMERAAEQSILICRKDSVPLSAAVIDLDDFKRINDSFGHHCGDAALIAVAACLRSHLRPDDILARIGGDEFAVLLPRTSIVEAAPIIERLRLSIAATRIVYGQFDMRVSASFGLAELKSPGQNWEQLFVRCDKALYEEKNAAATQFRPRDISSSELGLFPKLTSSSATADSHIA